ncbi:hypothetical protein AG4045_015598 [Apium graveolens]|uniref:Uncharacterized protein n=1 Tax=Apium graveolens TaxID=4045 RepID=A0A6L5BDL6_APIGR|nr:hypothetical protein AG4045_015598 [Apium graveolens]
MHAKPKVEKAGDCIGDHDHDHDHDEADEDILSLCDLPFNCKNKATGISSSPLKSSSPPCENQENLFEFFSEEWNVVDTTSTSPKISISKPVIPFPPPQAHDEDDDDLIFRPKNVSNSKPPNPRTKNARVLPRVTYPHHKRSNSTRMATSKADQPIITKSKSYSSGTSKSVEDQTKVSASPVKSKLLLVLFGLPPKIPTGQTMNDIKIRQSRHAPSTFFPSNSGGSGGCRDDQDAMKLGLRRSENRMWRVIKAVTCFRSQHREKLSFDE